MEELTAKFTALLEVWERIQPNAGTQITIDSVDVEQALFIISQLMADLENHRMQLGNKLAAIEEYLNT